MVDSLLLRRHLGLVSLDLLLHLLLDLVYLLLLLLVAQHDRRDVLLDHPLLRVVLCGDGSHPHICRVVRFDPTIDLQLELASCLAHLFRLMLPRRG